MGSKGPRKHKQRGRRGTYPRLSSPEGVIKRYQARIAATPNDDGGNHYVKPGSRNPRKVSR